MGKEHTSLLEWLRQRLGAEYLSDLKSMMSAPTGRWRLRVAVIQLQPERWPREDWADLVAYLTGAAQSLQNQEEARNALLRAIDV